MSQKPLAQRLDDIDDKLKQLVEINEDVVQTSRDFSIDLTAIKQEINNEVSNAFAQLQGISSEWNEVISYCVAKNISPRKVLVMLHFMMNEERNLIPKTTKEKNLLDSIDE